MEYEPQTVDSNEMRERLELYEKEFFALAHLMNVISNNTETILEELDKRLDSLVIGVESDIPKHSVT